MINIQLLNTDRNHCAPTVLAGYFKFGSRTLLLGDYGTTGGGKLVNALTAASGGICLFVEL